MMNPTNTEHLKDNLSQAGARLKSAALAASEAVKDAAGAASEELKQGRSNVKAQLSDSAQASLAAAEFSTAAAKEQVDALMDKGRNLLDSAAGSFENDRSPHWAWLWPPVGSLLSFQIITTSKSSEQSGYCRPRIPEHCG